MRMRFISGLAGILFATNLMAQIGGSGSIQGVISDPSGGVIPSASVVGTNVATAVKTSRQTTDAGYYVLSPLPPGEYTVEVSAKGFQTLLQEHVLVDALSQVGLNLRLKVGTTAEQITVSGTPPVVETADARLGQTMRNEVYTALPLSMGGSPRDPTAFINLLPGVQSFSSGANFGNVLGGQDYSTDVYVEGLAITNVVREGEARNLQLGISVEAVDQFQMETSGSAVMYNGQGASNYVLKSGTNHYHGAAYEYFRNKVLDARSFFSTTVPKENQNEFGGTVGGPIRKDRVFFFASYDGYRYRKETDVGLMSLPTMAERQGDFSALSTLIYDPATTACVGGTCTRQQFQFGGRLNVIPPNRISNISKYFESFLPDTINSSIQNNYLGRLPVGYNNYSITTKEDANLTSKQQVSVVFSHGHRSQSGPYREIAAGHNAAPLPYTETRIVDEIPTTALVRHTYTISPSLLNQFSYGFSRLWVPITNATIDGQYPIKAGLKGLPTGEADSAFPETAFAGPNVPTNWRGTNARAFTEALNNFTLQDNLQWVRGKHAVTLGYQMVWMQANEKARTYGSLALFNFSNSETAGFKSASSTIDSGTGNAYASYLLGALDSYNVIQDSVVETAGRYRDYAWWVQDNYKVTPHLTLNLGLRHDILGPYREKYDRMSFLNPTAPNPAAGGAPGILEFAGNGTDSCKCSTPVATNYKELGPRLGFAYSLNDKIVIRGAYSIMYTHRGAVGGRVGGRTGTDILGYSANLTPASPDGGITPALYWGNGIPAYQQPPFFDPTLNTGFTTAVPKGVGSLNYGDPIIGGRAPMYQNWNLGLQRALRPTIVLGVNYAASRGHFLGGGGRGFWSDQIDPKYLALGTLLNQPATPANIASAQAIVPGVALPYANFSGTIPQMLRPFPQYTNISDLWVDVANSNYNSMQVTLQKRASAGLTLNFNYTLSKEFDDTAGTRSAYNWKTEKAVGTEDQTHVVNATFVYRLPFGKGHSLGSGNSVVQRLASNWQLSGITTFRTGVPLGPILSACTLPQAGSCYADYNPGFSGPLRINGNWGSGDVGTTSYIAAGAFQTPAPFTYGNTPRTLVLGLRNPNSFNEDASLRRDFQIREGLRLAIQADAFNVPNNVVFGGIGTDIRSLQSFGKVTSQANSPRVIQFNARIVF